jgi:flagellar protein FlbT
VDAALIPDLRSMVSRGNYYSALCHLRQVLAIEEELLAMRGSTPPESKVA